MHLSGKVAAVFAEGLSGAVASGLVKYDIFKLVGQGGLSKKALNRQEDSRCKGIQGKTSKSEIKCVCLNECLDILRGELDRAIDSYVPMKKQGKRSKKKHLSKEAFRKIRYKQNMWRVYKHTGKDKDYEVYKEALNDATNEVRKAKRNFEHKLAQNIKSDSKSFYAYVRSKQNVRDKVGPLEDNAGNIITQSHGCLMAEELNMHFSSVFTREDATSLPETKFNGSEEEKLGQLIVTPEVVASKINNMKENKSPGVDGLSPKILKETVEQISKPLAPEPGANSAPELGIYCQFQFRNWNLK